MLASLGLVGPRAETACGSGTPTAPALLPMKGVQLPLDPADLADGRLIRLFGVAPSVFRSGKYRGFFFSREEPRMHVHVAAPDGEAKFWLEPIVALASHTGLSARELAKMESIVEGHRDEIARAWRAHFG